MQRKVELCELFALKTGNWVSQAAMCRCLQKLGLTRKKKLGTVAFAATERVQKLRVEYWDTIKHIEPQNKRVFGRNWDSTLARARTHARSQPGTKVTELQPFYRSVRVTTIGAVSTNKVLALMAMKDSIDWQAFTVFIEKFLCPQLWAGAVVVMDNLPAHKLASIVPSNRRYLVTRKESI